jgi:site-specific recombinase XerD
MNDITAPRPVSFAALVQQFFTEYLVAQRALSPRTIASYRDAMLLFLDFAHHRLGKMPTALNLKAAAKFGAQPQPEIDGVAGLPKIRGTARRIVLLRH